MSVESGTPPSKYRSTRNGFVAASLILAAATVVDLLRSGSYQSIVFTALIFSQLAFWGSRLYYDHVE